MASSKAGSAMRRKAGQGKALTDIDRQPIETDDEGQRANYDARCVVSSSAFIGGEADERARLWMVSEQQVMRH